MSNINLGQDCERPIDPPDWFDLGCDEYDFALYEPDPPFSVRDCFPPCVSDDTVSMLETAIDFYKQGRKMKAAIASTEFVRMIIKEIGE